jgi:hypothetical protein
MKLRLEVIQGLQEKILGIFSHILQEIKTGAREIGGILLYRLGHEYLNPPEGLNLPIIIKF